MTPLEAVEKKNWHRVWQHQEGDVTGRHLVGSKQQLKIHIGDHVRVSRWKDVFQKGYTHNFTEEVFVVVKVDTRQQPTMYVLKDDQGNELNTKFYAQELQVVDPIQLPSVQRSTKPSKPSKTVTINTLQQTTNNRQQSRLSRTAKSNAISTIYKRRNF